MSVIHPSAQRLEALRRRWDGQEPRLAAIATSLRRGEDWTVHLQGLPFVDEVPPLPGEAFGRDLRGADLRRHLRPDVQIRPAGLDDRARVAALTGDGLRWNTPLPGVSPFPAEVESAEEVALAMRRGDRFLLAVTGDEPVGVVRWTERREFQEHTLHRPYAEVSGLSVVPAWRRGGIGRRLLAAAEAQAAAEGHDHALLRTAEEVGLVPWYRTLGYEVRLTRQLTYSGAPTFLDVVMTRRIAAPAPPLKPTYLNGFRIVRALTL
jgi:ribosomal protein S18 acetylase RimI-like enzyme